MELEFLAKPVQCGHWSDAGIRHGGKCALNKFGGYPSRGSCNSLCPLMLLKKQPKHTQVEIDNQYQKLIDGILNCPTKPVFKGAGIVTAAGGPGYFASAYANISLLRELGCGLPIELWYLGRNEMDDEMISLMEALSVKCINAQQCGNFPVPTSGWPLKPYSIINSSFQQVIFIDADNFLLRDPAYLFQNEEYKKNGSLFWNDISTTSDPRIFKILRLPDSLINESEFESGLMVINKDECWDSLNATMKINDESVFFYQYLWGDKDTFRFGWKLCNQEYALIPFKPKRFDGAGLLQSDPNGEPLSEHRTGRGGKWNINEGNIKATNMTFQGKIEGYLESLSRQWSGCVLPPFEEN